MSDETLMFTIGKGAKRNIARIAKLPYGAKKGFIQRKPYLKKGFI